MNLVVTSSGSRRAWDVKPMDTATGPVSLGLREVIGEGIKRFDWSARVGVGCGQRSERKLNGIYI